MCTCNRHKLISSKVKMLLCGIYIICVIPVITTIWHLQNSYVLMHENMVKLIIDVLPTQHLLIDIHCQKRSFKSFCQLKGDYNFEDSTLFKKSQLFAINRPLTNQRNVVGHQPLQETIQIAPAQHC